MDDNEQTGEFDPSAAGRTEEYPTMEYPPTASTLTTTTPLEGDGLAFEQLDDENDEWLSTGPARGIRLAVPIAGLLAVLLVGAGFWGGVALEKNHGGSSSGAAAGGFASRARAAGAGGGGFSFGGGGASAASSGTAGTISVVDGNTLYILSSTGALVKVSLGKSTTITRNADSTPAGLRPGDTVTVQGTTSSNGNVAATSISTTAAGVSSSTGAFNLGGGAAANGASTAAGTPTTGGTTTSPAG